MLTYSLFQFLILSILNPNLTLQYLTTPHLTTSQGVRVIYKDATTPFFFPSIYIVKTEFDK